MDLAWTPAGADTERAVQVLYYRNATPLEMVLGTAAANSPGPVDLSPYVTALSQSANEAKVALEWHRELDGSAQPAPGRMIEILLNGQPLWWGIVEAVNDYRLQSGTRTLSLAVRSRDGFPFWRGVRRITDLYPTATPLAYIAKQIALGLGMTEAELLLPVSSGYTIHSNTQLADLSGWDMLETIYLPGGYVPLIDARGRLKVISRDLTRLPDVVLTEDRIVAVSGARNRAAVTAVRVKWLDPELTYVAQQDQTLGTFSITAGFFQLTQHQDVFFSDDQSQRAANTHMVIKQSANSGLLDFVEEEYEQKTLTSGLITLTTSVFAPALATQSLLTLLLASKIPDGVVIASTVPVGRVVHAAAEVELMLIMMCIGTGQYEVRGTPFDYVHARNVTEAYDCDADEWAENVTEIENDFVMSEDAAQSFAVRELIYAVKGSNSYSVTIVDDPRLEPGDIVELHDGTRIYVTGYTRDLSRGAAAVLDLQGFRVA